LAHAKTSLQLRIELRYQLHYSTLKIWN